MTLRLVSLWRLWRSVCRRTAVARRRVVARGRLHGTATAVTPCCTSLTEGLSLCRRVQAYSTDTLLYRRAVYSLHAAIRRRSDESYARLNTT